MRKFSAVWNVTKYCVWNCAFCCVDAICCRNKLNIQRDENFTINGELSLCDKRKVIDNLAIRDVRLDLSGGELLIDDNNLDLIEYASKRLGKENLGISISYK